MTHPAVMGRRHPGVIDCITVTKLQVLWPSTTPYKQGESDRGHDQITHVQNSRSIAQRASSRMAFSSPSSVIGYMRSSISWRINWVEWVYSQARGGMGLSQTSRGNLATRRLSQTPPGSSLKCSTLPPRWVIS